MVAFASHQNPARGIIDANDWRLANVIALTLTLLAGVIYIGNAWSPSSYSIVLKTIGAENPDPAWGKPRPIRSDEWAVLTPLIQATVNNKFERYNKTSLYGEDLRVNYGLPIHDWGIAFKPTMWLYGVTNPAYAYSFHWFSLTVLFVIGYALLFRWLGATAAVGFALSAGLYFTGFVQFWWDEKASEFALFPWVLLPFSTRWHLLIKAAVFYWVAVAWLLTNFYPPIQISLAFVGFLILLARDPSLFKPSSLIVIIFAAAAAAATTAFYLWDYLQATANTIYPGQRRLDGGSLPARYLLSWLFPSVNFDSNFSPLIPNNICEIGTVGMYYTLTVVCFLDYRNWRVLLKKDNVHTNIVLGIGFLLMLAWMLLPLQWWVGAPLLWHQVHPVRMQFAGGLLLVIFLFTLTKSVGLQLSWKRFRFFFYIVILSWLLLQYEVFDSRIEDLAILPLLLVAVLIGLRWPANAHTAFATASLASGLLVFGGFNPLQSAWPIFNRSPTAITNALDNMASGNAGVLAIGGLAGATANGLGYKSMSHLTAVPQMKYWRIRFPDMTDMELERIFSRYSHIIPIETDKPRLLHTDAVGVPLGLFVADTKQNSYPHIRKLTVCMTKKGDITGKRILLSTPKNIPYCQLSHSQ